MDNLFRNMHFVRTYIDDLIIVSHSHEEHLDHLKTVFDVLAANSLTINIDKCQFGKEEVIFLGHRVNASGYSPPQHRIETIENYPKPETITDLRRFIGMLNYYRNCIPHAAQLQAPLTNYLRDAKKKDKRKIPWTPESERAFDQCKQSIIKATQQNFLLPSAPLALTTDASDTAIGAALDQFSEGTWKPLGFFSRKLSEAESRYSTYDRELLAIFAGVKNFKHILEGRTFIIRTDHRPLVYAFSQSLEKASPRQSRQLDFISQFSTEITHIGGEGNSVADALSRINAITMPTILDSATIRQSQLQDDELAALQQSTSLRLQELCIDENKIFCDISTGYIRPYLPKELRRKAFDVVHGLSHSGGRTTSRTLREKYIWPGIGKDALRWSRECQACQRAKIQRHCRDKPNNIEVPSSRFNHVHLDLITLPLVGELRYCLTIIDRFSRWPHAVPLRDMQAETISEAFYKEWICQFGTPLTITTDQGTQFESTLFTALARMIGAHRIHTTPYHPQSNGILERWHRTLKAALMCSPHIPWPKLLPSVLLGLRTAYKEDLGASPAEMLFGTTLRIPGEFFTTHDQPVNPRSFIENIKQHFQHLKPVSTSHHIKPNYFFFKDLRTCTHVFRRIDAVKPPLTPPYSGPHKVIQRLDDKRYVIDINGEHKTISTECLKPAYLTADDSDSATVTRPFRRTSGPDDGDIPPTLHTDISSAPARRVRFSLPSPAESAAGRGVIVANQPSQRRRKQLIIPRADF